MNRYDHIINRFRHRFFEAKLKEFGINGPEIPYLLRIGKAGTIKMNLMIQDSPFHKSHTTRAINQLHEQGWVTKEVDPDDQRGFILSLTKAGTDAANKVIDVNGQWEALVASPLSEEEKIQMNAIHEKIVTALKDYFKEDTLDEKNY